MSKEIWIAAGTYKRGEGMNGYFSLAPNTSYIGGFAGWEEYKSQRNVTANKTIISRDPGDASNSKEADLFYSEDYIGDIAFEDLTMYAPDFRANFHGLTIIFNKSHSNNTRITRVKMENCGIGMANTQDVQIDDLSILGGWGLMIYSNALFNDASGIVTLNRVVIDAQNKDFNSYFYHVGITTESYKSVTISNSSIRNVIGYGVHLLRVEKASISNTVFENISAASGSSSSALRWLDPMFTAIGELIVTDTKFINCAGARGRIFDYQLNSMHDKPRVTPNPITFRKCEFTHDANCRYITDSYYDSHNNAFKFFSTGNYYLEDCSFNNLNAGNKAGEEAFIFDNDETNLYEDLQLKIRNCIFNFSNNGKLGVSNLYGGNNYLLMDGNRINNFNGNQPLFSLGASGDSYLFRPNNYYGSTLLDTVEKISGLGSDIVRLTGGAKVVITP